MKYKSGRSWDRETHVSHTFVGARRTIVRSCRVGQILSDGRGIADELHVGDAEGRAIGRDNDLIPWLGFFSYQKSACTVLDPAARDSFAVG